jgi:phage terminase small subunit
MPARKPVALVVRAETKDTRSARETGESALTPRTQLTDATPPILRGHKKAVSTWKRLVRLYQEIDGTIVTAFDADLLIKYCLLEEEVDELALMRKRIKAEWENKLKAANRIRLSEVNLKEWVQMWTVINALFARFQGMDARLDGKRKLLLSISQSMYLTPRSRAGVAPPEKPEDEPPSDMDNVLDETS